MRRALLTAAAAVAVATGFAAPAAGAERAIEMVSPPFKYNGGVVLGHRSSDDGGAVAFQLNAATGPEVGAYPLAPYVAHRTPEGWITRSAAAKVVSETRGSGSINAHPVDLSDDFSLVYDETNDPWDPDDREAESGGNTAFNYDIYRFDVFDRVSEWLSRPAPPLEAGYGFGPSDIEFVGRSRDDRHVFIETSEQLLPEAPAPAGIDQVLYESVDGELRQVAILPGPGGEDLMPAPGPSELATFIPYIDSSAGSQAVSEDGSRVYWQTQGILYLREDGERTLVVSESQRAATLGQRFAATFLGATDDGGEAYFHSSAQLTDDAPGGGIYRYDRASGTLTFLFAAPLVDAGLETPYAPQPLFAEQTGRLYFSSVFPLAPGAQFGMRNIYVWDGELKLAAATSLVTPDFGDLRMNVSRDGRYASFSTTLSLDPRHPNGVTGLYLYDADSEEVACVSCGAPGSIVEKGAQFRMSLSRYSSLGQPGVARPRNIADDGKVYFQTRDALVDDDLNGNWDVYEFDHGVTNLISSGRGVQGSELIDNSDDGSSVFFFTPESLSGWDVDGGYVDVYVAREGGGFPEPVDSGEACGGDACQGQPSVVPTFGAPATAGELGSPEPAPRGGPGLRVTRPGVAALRAAARNGRIALRVRVPSAGSVRVAAKAVVGGRPRAVGAAQRKADGAGALSVAVRLSSAARRQLARRGALRVDLTVRHAGERRALTLRLERPKAANSVDRSGDR